MVSQTIRISPDHFSIFFFSNNNIQEKALITDKAKLSHLCREKDGLFHVILNQSRNAITQNVTIPQLLPQNVVVQEPVMHQNVVLPASVMHQNVVPPASYKPQNMDFQPPFLSQNMELPPRGNDQLFHELEENYNRFFEEDFPRMQEVYPKMKGKKPHVEILL
ncbi:hypothetical protein LIER_08118 [Lithospermum erythrorhizon]|uniref:DUF7138 domain-containing protein n=1 Tax=Lithospermum erythrorhizon TaxID=34254 RepID=A0AAV3PFF1_LITER